MTADAVPIRLATTEDLQVICHHRRAMFDEMGLEPRVSHDESIAAFADWLLPRLVSGEYVGFLAEGHGRIAAGAGLWVMDWPPTPQSIVVRRGYVLNVYVEVDYRLRGLARRLLETAIAHAANQGLDVVTLHASDAGRPLYESMAFNPTNEMRLLLREPPSREPAVTMR